MNAFTPATVLLAATLLAGCETSTGILPTGPDSYFLSEMRAPVRGGGPEARRVLLAEATSFCQSQSRVFVPIDMGPDGDPFTPYYPTAYTAHFQCLPPGDPRATISPPIQ